MNLDEAQKMQVTKWIEQGMKLSEIQSKLAEQFGVKLTYMDVRFLVDDLGLQPKDTEPAKSVDLSKSLESGPEGRESSGGFGKVSVNVDQVTRPGAVVSGKVNFSDGNSASWYLDQMGRLGLAPSKEGYKPSPDDLQAFQNELQNELSKFGF